MSSILIINEALILKVTKEIEEESDTIDQNKISQLLGKIELMKELIKEGQIIHIN